MYGVSHCPLFYLPLFIVDYAIYIFSSGVSLDSTGTFMSVGWTILVCYLRGGVVPCAVCNVEGMTRRDLITSVRHSFNGMTPTET